MMGRAKRLADEDRLRQGGSVSRRRHSFPAPSASPTLAGFLSLHRAVGNRAMSSLLDSAGSSSTNDRVRVSNHHGGAGMIASCTKKVEEDEEGGIKSALQKKQPPGGDKPPSSGPSTGPSSGPATAPAKAKKAGVESFKVEWKEHPEAGPTKPWFRIIFKAKFKKDADHDPALAEFRQRAGSKWEITDGKHKGAKKETPLRDDGYTRADDIEGNKLDDVDFVSNDNPGLEITKDDVLNYSFTAEQTIIDTSQGNKEIAKRGPHTVTIKGKDPRTVERIPKTFS
jgi:hypothetical protein